MIVEKAGWYDEDMNLIASTTDEMVEYLDDNNRLTDLVVEYICNEYDMCDFIENIVRYEGFYMTRDDMIKAFAEDSIIEGESFDEGYQWFEWYDAGYNTDDEDE